VRWSGLLLFDRMAVAHKLARTGGRGANRRRRFYSATFSEMVYEVCLKFTENTANGANASPNRPLLKPWDG